MSKQENKAGMDNLQEDAIPNPTLEASAMVAPSKQQQQQPIRGFPVNILASGKADEKFCCSFCKLILRNPMQSSCGHRFCQECLKHMQSLPQPLQCKSCIDEGISDASSMLDFSDIFEDKAARREMKKLQVRCVSPGCQWKGSFNDFLEHEETCERKMVLCSQCGTNVTKSRLVNHETKSCPRRIVLCNFCQEQVVYEFREKHNEECPKFLIKCEKCETPVERSKVKIHQETDCVNRIVACPVPGCNTKTTLDKFMAHITKDENLSNHIVYLLEKMDTSEERLTKIERRISAPLLGELPPSANQIDQPQASASSSPPETSQELVARTDGDGAQADAGLFSEDRQKLKLHEDLMSVLHSEILRCITKGEALGRGMEKSENRMRDCYTKIEDIDKRLINLEKKYQETAHRPFGDVEFGELVNEGSGNFTWIIKGYGQVKRDASQKEREMVCSPAFFSCPGGYMLRLKLYANGEGREMNKNVSLYLQTVKGPNDDLLVWPFAPKVHFMLVDQVEFQQHHVKLYEADPASPASRRPTDDVGIASGCRTFITVQEMLSKMPIYWPRDVVYLKFHIETPKNNVDRLRSLNPLKYSTSSVRS